MSIKQLESAFSKQPLSLFDLPPLITAAIAHLKQHGIGRVHPEAMFMEENGVLVIVIAYFKALDALPAQRVRIFEDEDARYNRMTFSVGKIAFSFDKPVEVFGGRL